MGVGMVNRTLYIDPRLSELFCLSKHLYFGAGQRGLDNRGWTVVQRRLDTITCTQKVGVLPHIKHYTNPKSRSKASAAVLDEKGC